ncbi:MAG: phosphate signaling complex protein PhoU [Chitinivibrionales bacterium]|nr:phosphate signaling complex protein PhoU [Chitinivibrionales bacterium]
MERHFQEEINDVRKMIIEMGTLAEEAFGLSIKSFQNLDLELAQQVIEKDHAINALEISIDKSVFKLIALNQPVAGDLRFLFSAGKINKDLERIGDHAVNIAQATLAYASQNYNVSASQLSTMMTVAHQMLHDAITGLIDSNSQLALKVLEQDDQVDILNHLLCREVIAGVRKDITGIEAALEMIKVIKNLERIADLSTNIAEDVIFNARALDIKHHAEDRILKNKK